jgi:Uma2 family endonuclease
MQVWGIYTDAMAVEILTEAPLAPQADLGPYRRRDYDALPDQPRCELLFGRLYLLPSPTPEHQVVAQELFVRFRQIAMASGGRAYVAPLDVVLADHSVVQPDVIYISPRRLDVLQGRIEGAPDLVIEVLSPGTERRDRREKLALYTQSGVGEYWMARYGERQIEFLINQGGRFVAARPTAGVYRSAKLPEVYLNLAELWRDVEASSSPVR